MLNKWWFWRDSFIITGFIIFFIVFVIELFSFIDLLDPVEQAIKEVSMGDIVFSQLREDPVADTNVVIVNIGMLPRDGLAEQINILNKYNPKVIGIDALFFKEKDPSIDSALILAFSNVKNLVLPGKVFYNEETDDFQYKLPLEKFNQFAHNSYVNLTSEANFQDDFKICKAFIPKTIIGDEQEVAFGVKLVEFFKPDAVERFLKRNNDVEIINFRGNAGHSYNSNFNNQFFALDWMDVLDENFAPELIDGKIIIMGYLGDYLGHNAWEDKFFTPLNTKYIGRANPDMYGVVIHANIAAMIIAEEYIDDMDDWYEMAITLLLLFLNVVLLNWIYYKAPAWYGGLSKGVQLLEILIILAILALAFHFFNLQVELGMAIGAILLSGDLLEFFNDVIKSVFSSEKVKSLLVSQREVINSN